MNKNLLTLMAISNVLEINNSRVGRKLEPDFDLQKEYELIQQKKSKLSANRRRQIVQLVERQ